MAAGLHKVIEDSKYTRLVISRPISPLGKDLGYLPGSKAEKFNPWMQPIYDNMDILLSLHDDKNQEIPKARRRPVSLILWTMASWNWNLLHTSGDAACQTNSSSSMKPRTLSPTR
jgi:hypothetical protein